jgi:cytochrome b6-f complex iron-sulfur subunit
MAKRLSVKEILEAARKGGPAKPAEPAADVPEAEAIEASPEESAAATSALEETAAAPSVPVADVPTPSSLGRPLTLKEKLAAARAGGPPKPAVAASASTSAPKPAAAAATAVEPNDESAPAVAEPDAAAPPARPLGRPMTLQEKLAAARSGGAPPTPGAAPAKPAAAKTPAAAPTSAKTARVLPPLDKMTDPRDLAEAARQASKKAKDLAAKLAEPASAPSKPAAKAAPAKPQTVPPRPSRELAAAGTAPEASSRRGFMIGSLFVSWTVAWIIAAWFSFTSAISAMTLMTVRFMFPNVLAEPPSTIKIGPLSDFPPEEVSERYKAEWGFWIVRSSRYKDQDILYALQSVCTHLGCPPNWLAAEQKFKCPCHGSGFYITGVNFEGPAPRPLERFKIAYADDGSIMVDKSQKFQEELGQWKDPDSFIPA